VKPSGTRVGSRRRHLLSPLIFILCNHAQKPAVFLSDLPDESVIVISMRPGWRNSLNKSAIMLSDTWGFLCREANAG